MTNRIRGWQAKNLSYAAKLQLINSVLMGVSSYWCQMLILPKKVINCIDASADLSYGWVLLILINQDI